MYDTTCANSRARGLDSVATEISGIGLYATLYGLVLVFAWTGAMTFTAYEAGAIESLASSPLMSLLYTVTDMRGAAIPIGTIEIDAAVLLAIRPWSVISGAAGAAIVAATAVVTLSFLVSAPRWERSRGGFPALSVVPGPFLLEAAVLLGAPIWILGDAIRRLDSVRR